MTAATLASDPYATRPWVASYPPFVPAEIDPASYSTLVDMFRQSVVEFSGRTALESFGAKLTYAEFGNAARSIAAWLQSQGIAKGDRIAIMAPNVMAYPPLIFGVLFTGAIVVNVNPLYTPKELAHQIDDSGARMIFVLENFAHTVEAAWPSMNLEKAVVIAPGDLLGLRGPIVNFVSRYVKCAVRRYRLPQSLPFSRVLRAGARAPLRDADVGPDDLAFLQYTGGTTGVAKGAMLRHRNIAANVTQSAAWLCPYLPTPLDQVMVTALPLYHIFGLTACCLLIVKIGGSCLLIANPRDIPGFVKTLRKSRFTMISGVNTLYAALANHRDFPRVDFSNLIFCISGGMATQDVVARKWKEITGHPIIEGYGLSETSPVITCNRPDLVEFSGAIGYPYPSTQISIRLPSGEPAPFGERGELCVKGPQVMAGYWNRPEETVAATTEDGFLRTGDVAVMMPDGLLKIVDRLKEMILVSGFNVYPNEVENVLTRHPKVSEAAVIGIPDPHSGEAPLAFIVPRDPSVTGKELHDFCRETLTHYKAPRHFEFRDSLPKTNVGKVLRRILKEEYLARGK
ncbi:AMP-binding protein [Methylosinus sp. LW3]|uniref:AMP-binding protein n=1 Tax=Methylosinus sp. LW3 TaxID=107635 RepID=UPI0004678357|nr:AMP-binding protein [Methylosinus sp. LW3]